MRSVAFFACLIFLIFLIGSSTLVCEQDTNENPGIAKSKNPKIESRLEKTAANQAQEKKGNETVVRVIIDLLDFSAANIRALEEFGAKIEVQDKNLVQATVPLSRLQSISEQGFVRYVRLPLEAHPYALSEGASTINALQLQSRGVRGSGVKVAILDVGFQGYASKLGSELPGVVTARSFRADGDISYGTAHGTACAEIMYDIAAEAQLYLVNYETEIEYKNAVDWLISENVDIISSSTGVFIGPFDGTGYICDVVNNATSHEIFWAQSAANHARRHWEGNYSDSDYNYTHNFNGPDETQSINVLGGSEINIYLTWDDWPYSDQDYDLFLLNDSSGIVGWSESPQNGTQEPYEIIYYQATYTGTYHIVVKKWNATRNVHFELYTDYDDLEYQVSSSSLGIPADAAGAFTAGATYWENDELEQFSSRGPTNDGRTKPDVAAPDGVSTDSYAPYPFYGTSASAPHVAGAAALLLSANSSLNVSQLKYLLESGAEDLGIAGKDNLYGSGRIDVYRSYEIITPPSSITSLSNTTGSFWINWTWTNPPEPDFNHTMIYINNNSKINTSISYCNLTNLNPHNVSRISTRTRDIYGNLNNSWVNQTTQIPNNPIQITNVTDSYSLAEGQTLYIDASYIDADSDSGTFIDNSTKWNVNSATGIVSWTSSDGDQGAYFWQINVSDGYGSTSTKAFAVTVINSTPGSPSNLQNTTGNFWINWTWNAGNNADDYDIWINGIDSGADIAYTYYNATGSPHAVRTISVRAHNHTLNSYSAWTNQTTTLSNNPIFIRDAPSAITIYENQTISIDVNAVEADGDTHFFSCNRTDLFKDFNTTSGKGNFTPTYGQAGAYPINLGVSDGYGSTSNNTAIVTVINVPLTITSYWNNKTGSTLTSACWQNEAIQLGVTANRTANATWHYDGTLKQNSSSLNYTEQFTASGTHYINISAYDSFDRTANLTFTITVPETATDEIQKRDQIFANNPAPFIYYNTSIVKIITITAVTNLTNVSIEVQELTNVSSSLFAASASGTPYAYFNLTPINLTKANLTSLNITFTINKSWLQSSGLDTGSVRLNRYNNSSWEVYPAIKNSETSTSITYTAENIRGTSTFAITALSPQAPPSQPDGGGSSSGGSGGGATPGEPYENIADTEVRYILSIAPNKQSTVLFKNHSHHLIELSFAYTQIADETGITIEKLINSSCLAGGTPAGIIYENINIWVNVPNPGCISNASLKFSVEKEWISAKSIDPDSIAMHRFKDGNWTRLTTSKISENEIAIFYQASSPGFSPFAITGKKIAETQTPTRTPTPAPSPAISPTPVATEASPVPTKPLPGFELMTGALGVIILTYLRKRSPE